MATRNVSGTWTIEQSNGWHTDVDLTQNGSQLSGTAHTWAGEAEDWAQELDGTVSETNFALNLTWSNARGRYEGTFQPDGTLTGVTFDVQHPTSQATWFVHFEKKFAAV
jgi:hypothetical protein